MIRSLILAAMVILLSGCGAAHVRTDYTAPTMNSYSQVHVDKVRVNSTEQQENLLKLNDEFSLYAQKRLEDTINEVSIYHLVDAGLISEGGALVAETHIDVTYGSRAKRYWIGFGAGKGSVRSVLVLRDPLTNEKVLQLASDSDLTGGAFGGSMDATIRENIDSLATEFKRNLL